MWVSTERSYRLIYTPFKSAKNLGQGVLTWKRLLRKAPFFILSVSLWNAWFRISNLGSFNMSCSKEVKLLWSTAILIHVFHNATWPLKNRAHVVFCTLKRTINIPANDDSHGWRYQQAASSHGDDATFRVDDLLSASFLHIAIEHVGWWNLRQLCKILLSWTSSWYL